MSKAQETLPKLDNLPRPSLLLSQGLSVVEHWSPASTVRSTSPADVEVHLPDTPAAAVIRGSTRLDGPGSSLSSAPISEEELAPALKVGDGNTPSLSPRSREVGSSRRRMTQLETIPRRLMHLFDGRERTHQNSAFKVGPRKSAVLDVVPKSAASRCEDVRGEEDQKSPGATLQTDSVTRHQIPSSRKCDKSIVDSELSSPMAVRPPRRGSDEAEIKAHDPPTKIFSAAAAGVAPSNTVREKVTAIATVDTLVGEALDQGLVLPCAPSEDEKVMYYKSGRWAVLTTGSISYCTLLAGMMLFTQSSAHFYWYGVPTTFAIVYMCCHYFGVSMWGKDFDPHEHQDILRKGQVVYSPTIDVFLPVCNEPTVLLANTWNHVLALDYPKTTVHVLDDGGNDEVKVLAAKYGFEYIRRDNRPELKKAGNLRYAFARTSGEVITIFDADFCPRPDFLRETLPYLVDPSIGILQTPQFFRRRKEQTWIEQGAGSSQESFYRLIQVNLDRFNAAVCVGSCALYRREAVEPFGGVAPIEHSEDMYTGYKMTAIGYKVKYLPLCLAMGICPDEPRSFFMQQYRWCMGSCTLVLQRDFWRSDISSTHKLCFINGMLFYLASALFIFLGPTPILLLVWVKADEVLWVYFGFTVPAVVFSMIIIPTWSKQDSIFRAMSSHRVRVLQSYAHLFAIKDRLLGTVATWVPSGGKPSK
eukprot:g11801.t1